MKADRPDVLLGMGSYASVGPAVAAWSLGVPVVLHEANAVPGRAVSALSRLASAVAVSFKSTSGHIRHRKKVFTGFPVGEHRLSGFGGHALRPGVFTVLVMGGSQGARTINEVASEALVRLAGGGEPVQVVHLTGRQDEDMVRRKYERAGIANLVFSFLKDMGKAYGAADLAVARAGAATCAELAAGGVPAILVPLPTARRDHQAANARELERAGGVDVIAQGELSAERLQKYIETCRRDRGKLDRMKTALRTVAVKDGAERLADLVERSTGET